MSIIQNIRDKAAWLVFIVIALSLLGFLLMDSSVGGRGRGMFNGGQGSLGSVNGEDIKLADFQQRVQATEAQYQQQGYPMNEMMRQNIQEQVWNQFVEENVLQSEYEKLGLAVSVREVEDIVYGPNPPQDLRQQFSDENGNYDPNKVREAFDAIKKQKNTPMAENLNKYLESLAQSRLREKYATLLGSSFYLPKWMAEKIVAENSQLAAVQLVAVPYLTVSDTLAEVVVQDSDIKDFIAKHKEEYKQEESRSISYVSFSAAPTAEDSAAVRTNLENVRENFATATDVSAFLARNNSDVPFFDGYVVKSKLQVPNADTIRTLPDGGVFGPYLDGGNYVVAKMIGRRQMPDSVKCRHILLSTQGGVPDSVAKSRIDSIAGAIKGGASFAAMAAQFSEDPGSKDKGGEYDFGSQQAGNLAKEFADAIFYGNTGDKKVVKTDFGYHYIEVLNQKGFEQAYKIAYLSRPILASQQTENVASGAANQFAGESRDAKSFEANATKQNLPKLLGQEIKPNDIMIPGLGSSRPLVRWINEAKVGEVSEPFPVDDKYIVAVLTEINKEGSMSPAKARPMVELQIRNQKKAAVIRKKIGEVKTLDAVASATGQSIISADSVKFASPFIPNVGQEPKVIGAAFNKANQTNPSAPITGNTGVFVVKTQSVSAVADGGVNVEEQRNNMMMQARQMAGFRAMDALRKAAKVEDKRAKTL